MKNFWGLIVALTGLAIVVLWANGKIGAVWSAITGNNAQTTSTNPSPAPNSMQVSPYSNVITVPPLGVNPINFNTPTLFNIQPSLGGFGISPSGGVAAPQNPYAPVGIFQNIAALFKNNSTTITNQDLSNLLNNGGVSPVT